MTQKLNNGPISEDTLVQNLLNAKKLMTKVDKGDYSRGNINPERLKPEVENTNPQRVMENQMPPNPNINVPVNEQMSIEKIKASKLPEGIKEAMMKNPISLNDSLNVSFMDNAKQLMEKEGLIGGEQNTSGRPEIKPFSSQTQQPVRNTPLPQGNQDLKELIENTVRKVLTEVLDTKLTQILTAQQTLSINENLVLKVGDSIFQGRITGVKNTKK